MTTRIISSVSCILATISAATLPATPVQAQTPNIPIPYAQCVKNVFGTSGIIAKVKWYNPEEVTFIKPDPRGDNADTPEDEALGQLKVGFAKPVLEKNILAGQDVCMAGLKGVTAPRIAIISVVGGKFANEAVKLSIQGAAAGVGLLSCPATAGAGCAAALALANGGAQGAAALGSLAIPEAKEVFYIGFPGMLELKGTAFNPQATDKTLGVAQLPYSARVDFCHSALTDTGTGNKITVDFMSRGQVVHSGSVNGNVSDCGTFSKGYLEVTGSTTDIVDAVKVSTNGGDGLFVDQVEVFRDGTKFIWDGRQDGGGWCLSTDPNDHIGGWEKAASGCTKSVTFSNPAR